MGLQLLDINRAALEMFFGPLETAIMRAFWHCGASTTRQIYTYVRGNYHATKTRDLAFTSVTSTITRLHQRGHLIKRGALRNYIYTPVMPTESDFVHSIVKTVIDKLFEEYPRETGNAILDIVRRVQASRADAKEL